MNVSSTVLWNIVGWTAAAVVFELIRRRLFSRPFAEVQDSMNRALKKNWRQTPLAADVPRLARKIAVHLPTKKVERHDGSQSCSFEQTNRTRFNRFEMRSFYCEIFFLLHLNVSQGRGAYFSVFLRCAPFDRIEAFRITPCM
jgi:hypothetical protein